MGEFQQDTWTVTEYLETRLVMSSVMDHLPLCLKTLNDRLGKSNGNAPRRRGQYNQAPFWSPTQQTVVLGKGP